MKDHEIAQLVNELRDIAVEFHDHQSLRDRIARVVVPVTEELGAMNANYQALMQEFKAVKYRKRELETEVSDLRNTMLAREAAQQERALDALDKALEEGIETGLMLGKQRGV